MWEREQACSDRVTRVTGMLDLLAPSNVREEARVATRNLRSYRVITLTSQPTEDVIEAKWTEIRESVDHLLDLMRADPGVTKR